MDRNEDLTVFALNATRTFGEQVCSVLNVPLSPHEEREFEDGEHKARPLVTVRDKDVFVIQSLYGDSEQTVNDKLCRLLFFLGALRDASARRVTAIIPYLCYARKDRKTKPRDPVTTRYVAAMFAAVGTDHVVTLDVHNLAAYQNAWSIRSDHLEARKLFVDHFLPRIRTEEVIVVSPDNGGIKRAEEFRQSLSAALGRPVGSGFIEKYRSSGVVSGSAVVGDVAGKLAIVIDDLIASGGTLVRAAEACRARGAAMVYGAASHGVFGAQSGELILSPALERVVVTNTIPPFRLDGTAAREKVDVLDATRLFAGAIHRIHTGGSIVELLGP